MKFPAVRCKPSGWRARAPTAACWRADWKERRTEADSKGRSLKYEYDGDRRIDLKVCLFDYKDKDGVSP